MRIIKVSPDGQHALAMAMDQNISTLLRDGEPIISSQKEGPLFIEETEEDFSKLVVQIGHFGPNRFSLYLIAGNEKQLLESEGELELLINQNFERFLVSYRINFDSLVGKKTILKVIEADGHKTRSFAVSGKTARHVVIAANEDFSRICWKAKRIKSVFTNWHECVFLNESLRAEGDSVSVVADKNAEKFVALVRKGGNLEVVAPQGKIFEQKNVLDKDRRFTEDLSLGAVELEYKKGGRRLLIIRDNREISLTEPFDNLVSLKEEEGNIKAHVERNKIPYELTIS